MHANADAEGDAPALLPRPKRAVKKGRTKGMKRTEVEAGSKSEAAPGIDTITGLAYANVAASSSHSRPAPISTTQLGADADATATRDTVPLRPLLLPCPHPDLTPFNLQITETPETVTAKRAAQIAVGEIECEYVFGRAYDLRRHLSAVHGVVVEKGVVDAWALEVRRGIWVKGGGRGSEKGKVDA